MGERAVALCPASERYESYYSQWGGTQRRIGAVLAAGWDAVEVLTSCDWEHHQTPGSLFPLDFLSLRAVYLLSPTELQILLPVWLGVHSSCPRVPPWLGVFVPLADRASFSRMRSRLRQRRELLGASLERGEISRGSAVRLLWQSFASVGLPFSLSL